MSRGPKAQLNLAQGNALGAGPMYPIWMEP